MKKIIFSSLILISLSTLSINGEEIKKTIKNKVTNCSKIISLEEIVASPEKWLNQEICFTGKFSSFTNLALDYPPALRVHKDYVSLTLFRPDTEIPLSELKIAVKITDAQDHESLSKINSGDKVQIKGKVFSTAFDEPWVDLVQIQTY